MLNVTHLLLANRNDDNTNLVYPNLTKSNILQQMDIVLNCKAHLGRESKL